MRLKLQADEPKHAAFTLVEVLLVVVILAVLVGMLRPIRRSKPHAPLIICMSNQKQVTLAATVYAMDHSDRFPWATFDPSRAGSFSETAPELFAQLKAFAGPQIFVCPTDTKRSPTTNTLQSTNLSYFLNLSSRLNATNQVLLGDRHLALNAAALGSGQARVPAGASLLWTPELHSTHRKMGQGVVSFVDGHVEHLRGGAPLSAAFGRVSGEKWLILP